MTQLKSKSGAAVFAGIVAIAKEAFYIVKKGDKFIATTKAGEEIGEIVGETVTVSSKSKHASAGKKVKLASLEGEIDGKALVGKDPTKMSQEELAALTTYLQQLAAGKVAPAEEVEEDEDDEEEVEEEVVEEKPKKKKSKPAPVEEEEEDDFEDVEDDDEEEEEDTVEAPEGVTNYDELRKLGTKKLWAIAKPLALEGINSRSKLDELAEALAEYFGFALPGEEEEEDDADIENDSIEDVEDGEEEYDEEDEDDEEEDEDESDEDDEDEDEDEEEDDEEEEDDDEYEDDDEEEEEDDDIGITPEDVDAMKTKQEIQALMKKHNIKPPTGGKVTIGKVKAHIKEQLFGK